MPVMYLGTYQLNYGPNVINFDQETTVAVHDTVNAKQQSEPIGYTLQKLQMNGFLYSGADSTALSDMQYFEAFPQGSGAFSNRPCAVGFFTHDVLNSQPWFSNVGYLTSVHFEYRGGQQVYKYPFRFSFLEASPQTLIATSPLGDNTRWAFDMSGAGNGYIAGIMFQGTSIGLGAGGDQSVTILDDVSAPIGTGPILGSAANHLFSGNPSTLNSGSSVSGANLIWPLADLGNLQSIQRTNPTGSYLIQFNRPFNPGLTLYIVYLPL